MFILKFIPIWICSLMILSGAIGYYASQLAPTLIYKKLFKIIACMLLLLGIYLSGMKYADNWWLAEAEKFKQQISIAEAKSETVNTVIQDRVVVKKEIVQQRGKDIISYIDREIIKYDPKCEIPKEFVDAHNKGAVNE